MYGCNIMNVTVQNSYPCLRAHMHVGSGKMCKYTIVTILVMRNAKIGDYLPLPSKDSHISRLFGPKDPLMQGCWGFLLLKG